MNKLKKWLVEKYLPEWCRQELKVENARLMAEVERLRRRAEQQEAYIDGMATALRVMRKVIIKNEVTGFERIRRPDGQ